MSSVAFWESKTLAQMSQDEWEALCDGCGKCCLTKLIDDETEDLHFTNISCVLLNSKTCQCSDYVNRFAKVSDCVKVSLDDVDAFHWLPPSCAYKRLVEGRPLPKWHPLLHKGKKSEMHKAGASVRGKIVCETQLRRDAQDYIVSWPAEDC